MAVQKILETYWMHHIYQIHINYLMPKFKVKVYLALWFQKFLYNIDNFQTGKFDP